MKLLGDKGASVSHNPGSNMVLGNGIADMRGMLDAKVNVGIGTDGASCSDNQNMYENMRLASMVSKVQGPDNRKWIKTEEVLHAATAGSARALGLGDKIGKLEAGYKADIVFLDLGHINWIPFNDPTNQIVHTEDGAAVHSVMVAGRMILEDRKLLNVDMVQLARLAEKARERLDKGRKPAKALYDKVEKVVNTFCPGLAKQPLHIDRFGGGHHHGHHPHQPLVSEAPAPLQVAVAHQAHGHDAVQRKAADDGDEHEEHSLQRGAEQVDDDGEPEDHAAGQITS